MQVLEGSRSKVRRKYAVSVAWLLVALLGLGVGWSFASPHGSSADDDFHLTKIWCSWGESAYCQDAGDQQGVFVPRIVAFPACYVKWPAQVGAGCTNELTYEMVYTTRVDFGSQYPGGFHRVMGLMAGKDVVQSVQAMRIFNVALAVVLLGAALLLVKPVIGRALAVGWGVAIIPIGIFFIASTNASSWVIVGMGIYWAVLLSLLRSGFSWNRNTLARVALLLVLATMVLAARRDGGLYLVAVSFAVVLFGWKSGKKLSKVTLGLLAAVLAAGIFVVFARFSWVLGIWSTVMSSIPGALPATDQPNPVLKTLLEVPNFFAGLFGGQAPSFIMSDSGYRQGVAGYRPVGFSYGVGWTDFALPSIVGILALIAVVIVVSAGFATYSRRRILAFCFILFIMIAQVMLMRIISNFTDEWSVQPRFLAPYAVPLVGIALLVWGRRMLLSKFQASVAVVSVVIAGSVAWLATATRYAIGPEAAFTNFGQYAEWWWELGPSRLVWFIIVVLATTLWAWASIWNFGARPLQVRMRKKELSVADD